MADTTADAETDPPTGSKRPMLIGLIMLIVGGGGGFYATWSGMILGGESVKEAPQIASEDTAPAVAYVEVEPLVVSLRAPAQSRHLRFRTSLEVPKGAEEDVKLLLPRVMDVLNSYLRALDPGDLEDTAALTRLRAQMLRRVQVVVGTDKVNDLLIMEFVLN